MDKNLLSKDKTHTRVFLIYLNPQTNLHFIYVAISFGIICTFAFLFSMISRFGTSYAIDTGIDKSGIPKNTFTTNVTNDTTVNYVKDAYTAASQTNSYTSLFAVKLMKTNDNTISS